MANPTRSKTTQGSAARAMNPGWLLERASNDAPRGMITSAQAQQNSAY